MSINKIIDSVIETLNLRLSKRNMTTRFRHSEDAETIIGDRDQLTQVFQNLIDNAIKYGAENSEIEIDIDKHLDEETSKANLFIRIKNKGNGIAPEHIARLTERFYRVDQGRTRAADGSGSGLGLAVAQAIVQAHGGKISVNSSIGQGTTFWFTLPIS